MENGDAFHCGYSLVRVELLCILDPKDVYGPDFPSELFRGVKL
jgi:hypothetical protein